MAAKITSSGARKGFVLQIKIIHHSSSPRSVENDANKFLASPAVSGRRVRPLTNSEGVVTGVVIEYEVAKE
ncbi:MAG: hypothetical protein COT81_04195 [Candidatus Buchananbacteria bacterium CG10_big_fil_rev_8_21_14_0_10_42_9]|uniref:Uncharacterized protein n=1 Tax=Candidatus Buchananbacteria bacterium CG10_big_fil_rev_8_21_14_0_10_42_9 TaxID=1974526 RepID=A0A2H0W0D4_9BACT|nr:MAG: hypothetical protein COT81_04195 [Candidatus Buchananbacteria bacterium CG10_big_fil_rev_8_21_14_0_10_42_9]